MPLVMQEEGQHLSITTVLPGIEVSTPVRLLNRPAIKAGVELSRPAFSVHLDKDKGGAIAERSADVESKLTEMLLAKLFELMLPNSNENSVGGSATEDHWKSFLADAVAESTAKSRKFDLRLGRTQGSAPQNLAS
jgi:hypothetical protein